MKPTKDQLLKWRRYAESPTRDMIALSHSELLGLLDLVDAQYKVLNAHEKTRVNDLCEISRLRRKAEPEAMPHFPEDVDPNQEALGESIAEAPWMHLDRPDPARNNIGKTFDEEMGDC